LAVFVRSLLSVVGNNMASSIQYPASSIQYPAPQLAGFHPASFAYFASLRLRYFTRAKLIWPRRGGKFPRFKASIGYNNLLMYITNSKILES
jgi:hypothetical protein